LFEVSEKASLVHLAWYRTVTSFHAVSNDTESWYTQLVRIFGPELIHQSKQREARFQKTRCFFFGGASREISSALEGAFTEFFGGIFCCRTPLKKGVF
jgi:hypothetical protein